MNKPNLELKTIILTIFLLGIMVITTSLFLTNNIMIRSLNPPKTSAESLLGIIKPNGDLITNWNEGDSAPHWSKLDEVTGDMNGDGGNIRETSFSVHDRWDFTTLTIQSGYIVSKLIVNVYCKRSTGVYTYIGVTSNAFSSGHVTPPYRSYAWKSFTKTGLSIDQYTLDTLFVDVCPKESQPPNGWVDIETLYIEVYKKQVSESNNYLLLVHGYEGSSSGFNTLQTYDCFVNYYGTENIIAIDYYDDNIGCEPEFSDVTIYTSIGSIGHLFKDYILHNFGNGDTIDIIAHSMGGLVTRYMVKHHYPVLRDAGITINHIATCGTPNHGTNWATIFAWFVPGVITLFGGTQALQMCVGSSFLNSLNADDETPYSVDDSGEDATIEYSTFAILGGLGWNDGVVDTASMPLKGASNYQYSVTSTNCHLYYLKKDYIIDDIFNEISDGADPTLPPLSYEWSDVIQLSENTYRFRIKISYSHRANTRFVLNGFGYSMKEAGHWVYLGYPIKEWFWIYDYHYYDISLENERIYFYYFKGMDSSENWYQSGIKFKFLTDPTTIAHYLFDDGMLFGTSTRIAYDWAHYETGDGHDATLCNMEDEDWVLGMDGWRGTVYFDGNDEYVKIDPFDMPPDEITISFLVKSWDDGNTGTLFSYAVSGCDNEITIYNADELQVYIKGNRVMYPLPARSVVDGGWNHVVFVYSQKYTYTALYINAIRFCDNDDYWGEITPGGCIILAQDQDSVGGGFQPNEAFDGYIDELFIINKALNDDQVYSLYQLYFS